MPAAERLALLDAHRAVVDRRDDLVMRWIDLKLQAGAPAGLEAVRDVAAHPPLPQLGGPLRHPPGVRGGDTSGSATSRSRRRT